MHLLCMYLITLQQQDHSREVLYSTGPSRSYLVSGLYKIFSISITITIIESIRMFTIFSSFITYHQLTTTCNKANSEQTLTPIAVASHFFSRGTITPPKTMTILWQHQVSNSGHQASKSRVISIRLPRIRYHLGE